MLGGKPTDTLPNECRRSAKSPNYLPTLVPGYMDPQCGLHGTSQTPVWISQWALPGFGF